MPNLPRLMIAGTQSGVGKTTIALGIMGALQRRGLRVQAFKVGPDFIDPSYHTALTGHPSRNLDSWMLEKNMIPWIFHRAAERADVSVMEGVMGLFDSFGPIEDTGSTAEMAKILKAPVILIVSAGMMARSVAAIVQGYQSFDPDLKIAGIIFNSVGGPGHYDILRAAVEKYCGIEVLGYLPTDDKLKQPERHLGLIPSAEKSGLQLFFSHLVETCENTIAMEKVIWVAQSSTPIPPTHKVLELSPVAPVDIAVAQDEAFNFYYQDNLDILEALGARLHFFSPLRAEALPDDSDGLIFGGGFPEIYASELERNKKLRSEIHFKVSHGLPTYAECGGLMYLSRRIVDREGRAFEMVGLIDATTRMTPRLVNFGYAEVRAAADSLMARTGETARGHEFHYSDLEFHGKDPPVAYEAMQRGGARAEGIAEGHLLASYVHLHFANQPLWPERFVRRCAEYRKVREAGATL